MNNSDDKNKDNIIELSEQRVIFKRNELDEEILKLTKSLNEDLKNQEKYRKKMKILTLFFNTLHNYYYFSSSLFFI